MARARSGSARSSAPTSGASTTGGRGDGSGSRSSNGGAKSAKSAATKSTTSTTSAAAKAATGGGAARGNKAAKAGASDAAAEAGNAETELAAAGNGKIGDDGAGDNAGLDDAANGGPGAEAPELLAATERNAEARIVAADVTPEAYPMTAEIAVIDASSLLDDLGAPAPLPVPTPVPVPGQLPGAPLGLARPAALGRPDIHSDGPAVRVPSPKARRAAKRLVARKVGRIVRHVDPWSVLKVALLFNLFGFSISLVCVVLLWQLVSSFGVITDMEGFITEAFALESFAFSGRQIFRIVATGGLLLAIAATAGAVLLAVVFNLVSDLTGGIRVSVVEEETARSPAAAEQVGVTRGGFSYCSASLTRRTSGL